MNKLSSKELDLYSNKILEDYDAKNPSQIFKNKIKGWVPLSCPCRLCRVYIQNVGFI